MLNSLKCYLRGEYRPGGFPREFFDRWYKSEGAVENPAGACIFMCDGRMPHGGLSDRLKGALSTYRMARVMGYKFRIHWDSPFNLTDYLVPNRVQWQIAPSEISYSPAQAQPVFVMWNSRNRKWPRTFDTLRFVLFLLRRRRQQHIYSNTSLVTGGGISKLYKKLFKPSARLAAALEPHRGAMGPGYHSYSFRFQQLLGDFHDTMTSPLPDEEAEELMRRCGQKLLELINLQPEGTRALVASDSSRFVKYAAELSDRIYVIDGTIAHSDGAASEGDSDAWLKTFVDQHMIMEAEKVHLLRTGKMYRSGFPQFAAAVGGRPFVVHEF